MEAGGVLLIIIALFALFTFFGGVLWGPLAPGRKTGRVPEPVRVHSERGLPRAPNRRRSRNGAPAVSAQDCCDCTRFCEWKHPFRSATLCAVNDTEDGVDRSLAIEFLDDDQRCARNR